MYYTWLRGEVRGEVWVSSEVTCDYEREREREREREGERERESTLVVQFT